MRRDEDAPLNPDAPNQGVHMHVLDKGQGESMIYFEKGSGGANCKKD